MFKSWCRYNTTWSGRTHWIYCLSKSQVRDFSKKKFLVGSNIFAIFLLKLTISNLVYFPVIASSGYWLTVRTQLTTWSGQTDLEYIPEIRQLFCIQIRRLMVLGNICLICHLYIMLLVVKLQNCCGLLLPRTIEL